jgi:hypothetical protein
MDIKATVTMPEEVKKPEMAQPAAHDAVKVETVAAATHEKAKAPHPWAGMSKVEKIHYWVLVGFRSWQVGVPRRRPALCLGLHRVRITAADLCLCARPGRAIASETYCAA